MEAIKPLINFDLSIITSDISRSERAILNLKSFYHDRTNKLGEASKELHRIITYLGGDDIRLKPLKIVAATLRVECTFKLISERGFSDGLLCIQWQKHLFAEKYFIELSRESIIQDGDSVRLTLYVK